MIGTNVLFAYLKKYAVLVSLFEEIIISFVLSLLFISTTAIESVLGRNLI